MWKKVLTNSIKVGLAVALLWWLASTGKLDLARLAEMRRYPHRLLLAIAFCFFNIYLATWRLSFLLKARAQKPSRIGELLRINWIGMFFSSVLPGSVTGDVVKVFYLRKLDAGFSHAFLLFTCLLDRIMGLVGLILVMGLFSILNYGALTALSPKLVPLLSFNFFLLAAVVIGIVVFFFFPHQLHRFLLATGRRVGVLNRVAELWHDLSSVRPQIARAILLSVVIQFTGAVIFHLLVSPQYVTHLSLPMVLSFIPLGFMAVALPISPAGLGVGHAAFQSLFAFAGEPNGANFFNMYFVVTLFFNLLGFIPWLLLRQKASTETQARKA